MMAICFLISEAKSHCDRYELHVAAVLQKVLEARLHEEGSVVRDRDLPPKTRVPGFEPGAGGVIHRRQGREIAGSAEVEAAHGALFNRYLPQMSLLAVPAETAEQIQFLTRRSVRQVQLQVGIAPVEVRVSIRVLRTVHIEQRARSVERTVASVHAYAHRQVRGREPGESQPDIRAVVESLFCVPGRNGVAAIDLC